MTEFERYLETLGGNKREAARRLKCSRAHIYNLLKGKAIMDRTLADRIYEDSGGQFNKTKLIWDEPENG